METLYKYRDYSKWPLEMLMAREIYFSTPQQLNDPYDCRISIRQALSEAVQEAIGSPSAKLMERLEKLGKLDHVYERMEVDIGSVGVFSMSKRPDNVVMWAHYADNHAGFCAGFKLSPKFRTHVNDFQVVGTSDVIYSAGNPFADYFNNVARQPSVPSWGEFWKSVLSLGMVAKAAAWAYEQEVRVLRKCGGPVPFEPSELVEIVFGMNMPMDQQASLRELVQGDDWRHVRFRRVVRSEGFSVRVDDCE